MPTYEYACESCGNRFDAVQKMSDMPLTTCQSCKGKVHRILSGGLGVSFKGSGFYVNDSTASCVTKKADTANTSASCAGCPCAKAT